MLTGFAAQTAAPQEEYCPINYINFDDISPIRALEELGLKVKEGDRGYPDSHNLLLVLFASVLRSSLESVSKSFRDVGLDVPSADAVLKNITKKTVNVLERLINRVLLKIFSIAWIRSIPAVVSMDLTDILYYGKSGDYVSNTKPREGTHKAFKFLTVSVVSTMGKFVPFVKLVKQGEDTGKPARRIVQRLKKNRQDKVAYPRQGFPHEERYLRFEEWRCQLYYCRS